MKIGISFFNINLISFFITIFDKFELQIALMLKTILLFITLLLCEIGNAQQDSQFTQYMYNTVAINPAYAGSRETTSIFLLHRNQWLGQEGAPITNVAALNSGLFKNQIGIGLSFSNDNIGATTENIVSADMAYNIQFSTTSRLAFGLKTSANFYSLDANKLNIFQQNDPEFQNLNGKISPNIGAGIYYYSDSFFTGFSVPNFMKTKYYTNNEIAINKKSIHYYFLAGYIITINPTLKFKPSFLSKVTEGAPFQLDINANFLIQDKLTIGGSYRMGSAISGLIGFQISSSWFLGYGYDQETTRLSHFNKGSHEVFLRYEIFKPSRVVSPRFF